MISKTIEVPFLSVMSKVYHIIYPIKRTQKRQSFLTVAMFILRDLL